MPEAWGDIRDIRGSICSFGRSFCWRYEHTFQVCRPFFAAYAIHSC